MPPVRNSPPPPHPSPPDGVNRLAGPPSLHFPQQQRHDPGHGHGIDQQDDFEVDSRGSQYPASEESSSGRLPSSSFGQCAFGSSPLVTKKKTGSYYCSTQYPHKLLRNLNQLRVQGQFCDVQIVAGSPHPSSITYPAHRFVLSAASAYFEAMFRPELGLTEVYQKTIILHTIDAKILAIILDFIYTGRCEITRGNVQDLLAAADMLQLPEIVDGCSDFLLGELHSSNALGILRFAEAHHCKSLIKAAQHFVHHHFPDIVQEEEFLDTPHNILLQLFSSEFLRVDTESQVFQAALRWLKHDVTQRRCYIFEIMSVVRLALVPVAIIEDALRDCNDGSVRIALKSIYTDLATKRGQLVSLCVYPRRLAKKCIYVVGGTRRESSAWNRPDDIFNTVVKYDIFRRQWTETTAAMEIGRILPGVAVLNNRLYVVGGERGAQILANGEVYDSLNNCWTSIKPMEMPRCDFGLCAMDDNSLLAVGGWIGDDIGDSMERYDPDKDLWTIIGNLQQRRFSMGVVSFEGLIYIVGGCSTYSRHLSDLGSYNPVTGEWQILAQMKVARCQMGVAILDRHLYVVGGNSSSKSALSSVERYSFDDNQWSTVCSLSTPRASPAVVAADGLLYAIGGDQPSEAMFYCTQVTISSVECYDPYTDSWSSCPDLPVSRSEAGAAVV